MPHADFHPNQFRHATVLDSLTIYREGWWRSFEPQPPVPRRLGGRDWCLRPGLTFTPYANPKACNAHCSFCSEELLRLDASRLSAKSVIGNPDLYFEGLHRAWTELAGFPMGLSLSGLEATADPVWMLRLLSLVRQHSAIFPERVLYSNGTGLCTHPELITALNESAFDRVELSRCHFDAEINQQIMRFDRNQPIRHHADFIKTLMQLQGQVTVKLSCIINDIGVATLSDIEHYIVWAADLGIKTIVFRELSAIGKAYVFNRTAQWVEEHRVSIRGIMDQLHPEKGFLKAGWEFIGATSGYYYYNEVYCYAGVEIILEASSYIAHKTLVDSGIIQKLVFHSTGDLCGDWVPDSQWIGNYFIPGNPLK